ncbi:MAG: hypothetical protein K8S87_12585 [Planctomycetes bacterium]|nr:hypothetical protein [Planctomycetota bacterium]
MNEKKKELISNFIDGELDADDTRTAEILISADFDIRKMYEEIKSVDTLIETLPEITPTSELRVNFINKLASQKIKSNNERKLRKTLLISTRFAIASSILLLITLSVFIFVNKFNNETPNNPDNIIVNHPAHPTEDSVPNEIKPDENMFEYMDLLSSVFDFKELASIDESILTGLENNADLALVEAALSNNYYELDNFSKE